MKATIVAGVAVLVIQFGSPASAATGAPSTHETGGTVHSQPTPIDMDQSDAGSYARYLMLNGASRPDAIELARNVDHATSMSIAQKPALLDSESSDVGSYARYLMLNGKSREDAIQLARNIDRGDFPPVPARTVAM